MKEPRSDYLAPVTEMTERLKEQLLAKCPFMPGMELMERIDEKLRAIDNLKDRRR